MMCVCGHLRHAHTNLGCFGPYRGMRDDHALCTCPSFTPPCRCGYCETEAA